MIRFSNMQFGPVRFGSMSKGHIYFGGGGGFPGLFYYLDFTEKISGIDGTITGDEILTCSGDMVFSVDPIPVEEREAVDIIAPDDSSAVIISDSSKFKWSGVTDNITPTDLIRSKLEYSLDNINFTEASLLSLFDKETIGLEIDEVEYYTRLTSTDMDSNLSTYLQNVTFSNELVPTHYVSTTGDDSDGLTPATAYKTIGKALSDIASDDVVVLVASGIYVEKWSICNASGNKIKFYSDSIIPPVVKVDVANPFPSRLFQLATKEATFSDIFFDIETTSDGITPVGNMPMFYAGTGNFKAENLKLIGHTSGVGPWTISMANNFNSTLDITNCHLEKLKYSYLTNANVTISNSIIKDCPFNVTFNNTADSFTSYMSTFINSRVSNVGTGGVNSISVIGNVFLDSARAFTVLTDDIISNSNVWWSTNPPTPRTSIGYNTASYQRYFAHNDYIFDPELDVNNSPQSIFIPGRIRPGTKVNITPADKLFAIVGDSFVELTNSFAYKIQTALAGTHTFVEMPGDPGAPLGIFGTGIDTIGRMGAEFVVSNQPESILYVGGVNSLSAGYTVQETTDQTIANLSIAKDIGVPNIIYGGTQIQKTTDVVIDANSLAVENAVETWCLANGVTSIKSSHLVQQEPDWQDLFSDGLHLNNAGNIVYQGYFQPTIEDY